MRTWQQDNPLPVVLFDQQNRAVTLISRMQNKFVSKLQRADSMNVSTLELLQWPLCQMRSSVTNQLEINRAHILYETEFINSGVTYTCSCCQLNSPLLFHLYIKKENMPFLLSFSFCLLFSEGFEEYNSYLCSSVAIFRMAQISGDPRLFLHLL